MSTKEVTHFYLTTRFRRPSNSDVHEYAQQLWDCETLGYCYSCVQELLRLLDGYVDYQMYAQEDNAESLAYAIVQAHNRITAEGMYDLADEVQSLYYSASDYAEIPSDPYGTTHMLSAYARFCAAVGFYMWFDTSCSPFYCE